MFENRYDRGFEVERAENGGFLLRPIGGFNIYFKTLDDVLARIRDDFLLYWGITEVGSLDWSIRTGKVLMDNNICELDTLRAMSDKQLLKLTNFGQLSLKEVRDVLDGLDAVDATI